MKIALPFDGSPCARRALDYAIATAARSTGGIKIDIVNVQEATVGIPESFTRDAVDVADQLVKSAREAGTALLDKPIAQLKAAKLFNDSAVLLGDPASCIAEYVGDNRCDAVIMGTRGLSPIGGLVLGAVASKVIHAVKVPVTLVK
jgi:nucleotide-binding universal stress UspA family protein